MRLSVTPTTWATGTSRFFSRGRSARLQVIDAALDAYDAAAKIDWSSANAEQALIDLETAINDWKGHKGLKANGKIDSCRDSKRLVSDLLDEIPTVLAAISQTPGGRQRAGQKMAAKSSALAKASQIERETGGEWEKNSSGKFDRKIYTQQLTNSCTCACACTFASYLNDVALREEVFREKYDSVVGKHDFSLTGSFLPEVARTLEALGFDAGHVATADWNALRNQLLRATQSQPILFAVTWDGGVGAHALICKGHGTLTWDDNGVSQTSPGFLVQDPWRSHKNPLLFDDGGYFVFDQDSVSWQQGYADPRFGGICGKRSVSRQQGPKILSQGVKLPGM